MVFLVRLLVFLLPCAIALAFPLYVIVRSGEIRGLDLEGIVDEQVRSSHRVLFGPAFSDCTRDYKLQATLAARPTILAMGTSRVMAYRAGFFVRSFYNAGGACTRINQFAPFLAQLPREGQPSILLVSLDQYFFNAAWHRREPPIDHPKRTCTNPLNLVQRSWLRLYRDWAKGKFGLGAFDALRDYEPVGLNAQYANGFRNDGSYYYGQIIQHPNEPRQHHDFGFEDTYARIRAGTSRFEYGDHLAPELVAELRPFLEAAAERGIHVIAVIPPYAPSVNDRMGATGRYGYMREIAGAVRPLVESTGGAFFDFTDVRHLGLTDDNFIDGFHGSERVYLTMLLAMARVDRSLAEVVDTAALRGLQEHCDNPLTVASDRW